MKKLEKFVENISENLHDFAAFCGANFPVYNKNFFDFIGYIGARNNARGPVLQVCVVIADLDTNRQGKRGCQIFDSSEVRKNLEK